MERAELKNAKWVSSGGEYCSVLFRKVFDVKDVKQAEITIASLGLFEGYINGKKISYDLFLSLNTEFHERMPITTREGVYNEKLSHRLYCPVYDITDILIEGKNAIGIINAPGWYERPHDYCNFGNVKLAFCIKITHTDESEEYIVSDEAVKRKDSFVKKCDIINGESFDFNGYDDNWAERDFDDSTWEVAVIEKTPETNLFVQDCPADRVIRHVNTKLITEKDGVRIYEADEMISGYPVFVIPEGETGEINIRYGEKITEDGLLNEDNIYLQHTDIIPDGKRRIVHSKFTWMCFKYFEVKGNCELIDCLVIHSDIDVTSDFKSSDETLNWLYDAYIRTQLANMHCGIPSDCPHIERKGYTGDGQLTARTMMTFLDVKKFLKKWIYDISDCQDRRTGHVQYTAPFSDAGGGPGGWGGAIVIVPYEYYKFYNDKSVLEDIYPQMIHYFDFMETHSENEVVTSNLDFGWCLGEWCTPEQIILNDRDGVKLPPPYINTYFYIKTMQMVLEIEDVLGKHEHTKELKARIERKKEALLKLYFNEDTGNFCENYQGGNAFAIDIGIGDERTFANMVENYKTIGHYDTGIFGTNLVTRLLFENGYHDIAFSLLTSKDIVSFYNQKKMGATTILENWNGVRSQCHPMFGAVTVCLAEFVLGIKQRKGAVGYEDVIIEPMCMDILEEASGYIITPKGKISVSYNKNSITIEAPKEVKIEIKAEKQNIKCIQ